MSVGFGFSVHDFVGAVKIVRTVINALSANSQCSDELRALLRQLRSLETTLQTVEQLKVDGSLKQAMLGLKQSTAECQSDITSFLRKAESYHPRLFIPSGSSTTPQDRWRKVKWALCKKKDIVQFKTDLLVHTQSIQIILTTIQMGHNTIGLKRLEDHQKSIPSVSQNLSIKSNKTSAGVAEGPADLWYCGWCAHKGPMEIGLHYHCILCSRAKDPYATLGRSNKTNEEREKRVNVLTSRKLFGPPITGEG
ncbi:MAG: hypothetical protein Q9169_007444 [Polycauliona sp. 2 TL-2023]